MPRTTTDPSRSRRLIRSGIAMRAAAAGALVAAVAVPVVGAASSATAETVPLDLGTLGGPTSAAVAVNASGAVTGDSDTASGAVHAFRWVGGTMQDLGTLGGRDSHAVAMNTDGEVAGYAQTSSGQWRAVLWPAKGKVKNLG